MFEKVNSKTSAHLLVVVGQDCEIRPGDPENISSFDAVDRDHAPQRVRLNDDAPLNMYFMFVTEETSQSPIGWLKFILWNMAYMFVTEDTSQLARG